MLPSAGQYAPRPSAAAPEFTFGHLNEKQESKHAGPAAGGVPAHEADFRHWKPASYDPPAEKLRWWKQPRSAATVSGSCNRDVEAFWAAAAAEPDALKALVNVDARLCNKAQGLGSSIAASLGNRAEFDFAPGVQSLYKSDLCSTHKRVGKRGVAQPEEAIAAVSGQAAWA